MKPSDQLRKGVDTQRPDECSPAIAAIYPAPASDHSALIERLASLLRDHHDWQAGNDAVYPDYSGSGLRETVGEEYVGCGMYTRTENALEAVEAWKKNNRKEE